MFTDPKSKHTFRFGALIGKIGKNGDWFLVGTNYDQVANATGPKLNHNPDRNPKL